MTVILPPARALSHHIFSRASQLCSARFATSLRRVNPAYTTKSRDQSSPRKSYSNDTVVPQCRSYATATPAKAPGRPKAHTGRTAAPKRKPTTTTRKTVVKKKAAVKAKPKRKTKAKPKPKPKKKKVLTEKQKAAAATKAASQKTKDLKAKALLDSPKGLPSTAWMVLLAEESQGKTGGTVAGYAKEASQRYKNMTPEEHERLNHIANENKAKNDAAHKKWLSSFTPKQILEANNARNALRAADHKKGGKKTFSHIQDDRLVKRPMNAYSYFFNARHASGDMNGMKVAEVGSLMGREWKALTASEKKTYEEMAEKDQKRYILEHKTVYGEDAQLVKAKHAP